MYCMIEQMILIVKFPDIDECASSPCLNGATCEDEVNYYTCTCDDGYTGTHCETGNCETLDIYSGYITHCSKLHGLFPVEF